MSQTNEKMMLATSGCKDARAADDGNDNSNDGGDSDTSEMHKANPAGAAEFEIPGAHTNDNHARCRDSNTCQPVLVLLLFLVLALLRG